MVNGGGRRRRRALAAALLLLLPVEGSAQTALDPVRALLDWVVSSLERPAARTALARLMAWM